METDGPTTAPSRRRFLLLAGATITTAGMIIFRGEPQVSSDNRWYGLFTPGRDVTRMMTLADQFPVKPSVAGIFLRLNTPLDVPRLSAYSDRGLTPFVTLEPWPLGMAANVMDPAFSLATLNAGSHDADLSRIAAVLAAYGKPVYVRLAHEMNGHWYPWAVGQNGNTPADYLTFWKRVRTLFAAATNVRWVWACAAIHGLRTSAPDVSTVYPGDALVDYVGTTGYGWDVDAATTYGKTFTKLATITTRDFVIPEMGAQQPVNKVGASPVDWTRSLAAYLRATPRIKGFVWFDIDPSIGATGDYRLTGYPATLDAFNRVLSDVPITTTPDPLPATSAPVLRPPVVPQAADTAPVAPASETVAQNVIKGQFCSIKGPKYGLDKYGNRYVCFTTPEGWTRWAPVT